MPTSNVGQGLGLGSKFTAADAMWINNRNRQSAQKAATNAIDAKEREKASEYVTKYIDVNNSGINPIWAGKAKEQTTKYLNDFYTGMRLDPNYAKSTANIKAFQDLAANLDKWKIASENLGKTAQLAYTHPEDVEVDAQVNEAINSGDYAKWEAVAKAKGVDPDTYSLGFGTLAKPNMIEHNKHVMNGVYGTTRPSMKEVQEGDFIAAYQVDNGNIPAYEANAIRLYNSDPLAKAYFEAKGTGFEGYKALLEKPLPQSKFSHVSQKQKWGGNNYNFGGGGYTSNSMYVLYPVGDSGDKFRFAKSGANTETSDKEFVPTKFVDENGDKVVDITTGNPLTHAKGNLEVIEPINGEKMAGIRVELPNYKKTASGKVYIDSQKKTISKILYFPLDDAGIGQVWAATNDGKNGGLIPKGYKYKEKVQTANTSSQPGKEVKDETPKSGTPKQVKFALPQGKPRRGKKGDTWYVWDENTGKYVAE